VGKVYERWILVRSSFRTSTETSCLQQRLCVAGLETPSSPSKSPRRTVTGCFCPNPASPSALVVLLKTVGGKKVMWAQCCQFKPKAPIFGLVIRRAGIRWRSGEFSSFSHRYPPRSLAGHRESSARANQPLRSNAPTTAGFLVSTSWATMLQRLSTVSLRSRAALRESRRED